MSFSNLKSRSKDISSLVAAAEKAGGGSQEKNLMAMIASGNQT